MSVKNKPLAMALMFFFLIPFSAESRYSFLYRVKQRTVTNGKNNELLKHSAMKEHLKLVLDICSKATFLRECLKCSFGVDWIDLEYPLSTG
jgi:hypothetical protein